jgi:quercetin dioxygenase-like cupin family protein
MIPNDRTLTSDLEPSDMTYPDRLRLPIRFDPVQLRRDLEGLGASSWIAHFVKQNYEGDWDVLPLRGVAGARHPVKMIYSDPTATAFEDTPLLADCGYFREVLAAFACELQTARLMRLSPGSIIKEHRDPDLDAESGAVRLHIPIVTNPDVAFELNGTPVAMQPGDVWYLRLSDPHRVANRGPTDRVHMVIDAVVNDWVRGLLDSAIRQGRDQAPTAPP